MSKAKSKTKRKPKQKRYAMIDPVRQKYNADHKGRLRWVSDLEEAYTTARCMGMVVVDADEFSADPWAVMERVRKELNITEPSPAPARTEDRHGSGRER